MKYFVLFWNRLKISPISTTIAVILLISTGGACWKVGTAVLSSSKDGAYEAPVTSGSDNDLATNSPTEKKVASDKPSTPAPTETKPKTTTTTPTATTQTPKPTPKPTITNCTNPVFTTSDTNGGWSTNGYYVHNNMWNVSGYSVFETLYACSYRNWYVKVTANNNSGDGAVKTYPNVHKDYSGRTISSFSTLKSSFAATTPGVGIYNVAYDLWLNGVPNEEVMIWTDNFHQVPAGDKIASNVSLSGYKWDVYDDGDGYTAFVPSGGVRLKSGTLDLKAMLNYLVSRGIHTSNATVDQICYGIEIVSTSGSQATFSITNFSITD